jgi:phage-related protein
MANQVEIKITADPKDAEAGLKKVKSGFQSMKDSIVKNRKAIGVGILAMGAGIEALAQKQAGLTESTRKLANATQFSEGEIRTMASSLSNATFPLDEVLGLMELGAQQGLESAEALKEYAGFWDTVGDATGLSSEALAKAGAALAAVGVEVGNESELLGAFGLISQESTQSVKDFLDGISRMAPEMSAMGISVDEAAVIMTAMERELGLTARTARTEFKEALEQSETGLAGVLEQLGLSEAQIATYSAKLGESSEVIQANADAHASTKTVMDKLKSSFSDLAFANGAMIEKASMMAPIFMAAGPIMAGFSGIMGILTPAVSAAKLAFIGLNLSMGPITLVIIGIGVAIIAAILIWKNFDKIILVLKKSLEVLKATFKTVFDFIKAIVSKVFTAITDIYNSKLGWLLPAGPLIKAILFLKNNWDEIWAGIQTTFKTVTDSLIETFRSVKGTILGIWEGMVSGIKSAIDSIKGKIDAVINAASRVGGAIRSVTTLGGLVGREHGGPVGAGQPVIVGERRPELFVPHTSGTILPRITQASGGGGGRGGGGMTINLVINGDILGMDDFESKVTSVIRDAVLGGGFSGVLARA